MERHWSFDSRLTRDYTEVRQAFTREFLSVVRAQAGLESALDVGCGVGYFSRFLADQGFRVTAIDARSDNSDEGKRRHPDITFLTRNIEDPGIGNMGSFDFVLCVGLLYHLENPFRAIRNLHSLTDKVLLVESMCIPGDRASLLLLDEGAGDNQGLNLVAFYPSKSCLVKMLYRAGFPFVYRFRHLPNEMQFRDTLWRKQSRSFLAASKVSLVAENLLLASEKAWFARDFGPWTTGLGRLMAFTSRTFSSPAYFRKAKLYRVRSLIASLMSRMAGGRTR